MCIEAIGFDRRHVQIELERIIAHVDRLAGEHPKTSSYRWDLDDVAANLERLLRSIQVGSEPATG